MSQETTTSTIAGGSEARIPPEAEDTPQGSLQFRSLPTPLVCLLATTPIGGLSAYDVFTREFVMTSNTISMEEESSLASLSITSGMDLPPAAEVLETSEADAANQTRLALLAREYVNKHLSQEEDARLSIVTERVRRLIPRVKVEDFEALERIAERLQNIGSEDAARRSRLGIS